MEKIVRVDELINEIKELKGSTVRVFGQEQTISDVEHNEYCPNVLSLLEGLKEHESEILFDLDTLLENTEEVSHNNSYNWGSNIDHDVDYKILKGKYSYYLLLAVHRYGDVRGNYTNYGLFTFDNEYDILEVLSENTMVDVEVKVDEEYYRVSSDIFHEGYDVFLPDGTALEVYGFAENEDEMRELIQESIEVDED